MALLDHPNGLTVTEAAHRGVARLMSDAEHGTDVVVTRRNRPIAAVVGFDRLAQLEEAESHLRDRALVKARSATDSGRRVSFDEVAAAFGHTGESLAALPDDE